MIDVQSCLEESLEPSAAEWLASATDRLHSEGSGILPVLFPALARKTGREPLRAELVRDGDLVVDLGAWRTCDAAGLTLVRRCEPDDAMLCDLFWHGDYEERSIVMRCLAMLEIRAATTTLLGEAQRTNTQVHFEACVCDSNLVARAIGKHGFTADDAYKVLLKAAFVDLPLHRLFGILEHASPELSQFVTGLATEREAAGRAVWVDTNRVIAHAPIDGSRERIAAGVDHPEAAQRLASADAVSILGEPELIEIARKRFHRERDPDVRAALAKATGENES